jgi:transposase
MKTRRYSPSEFALEYAPLKSRGLGQREIAARMNISRSTLQSYLDAPDYNAQIGPVLERKEGAIVEEGQSRSDRMINAAFSLHEKLISDSIKAANQTQDAGLRNRYYEAARLAALDALKICKVQAEIQRVFAAIQINYNPKTLVLNQLPREDYEALQHRFYMELWQDVKKRGLPCPFEKHYCELNRGDDEP